MAAVPVDETRLRLTYSGAAAAAAAAEQAAETLVSEMEVEVVSEAARLGAEAMVVGKAAVLAGKAGKVVSWVE